MNIQFIPYIFTGSLPNLGKGPYGFDSESITLKPQFFGGKCYNKAAEVCLVSGLPDYSCFFHAFIWHSPKNILSYNTFISGLTEKKLRNAANFRFVRNQLQMILNFSNPLIVGCNINSDFKSFTKIYLIYIHFLMNSMRTKLEYNLYLCVDLSLNFFKLIYKIIPMIVYQMHCIL
jgi:hypothetical protein